MRWQHGLAYFFGAAFFANALPHFMAGVMGSPFQSPFASPPGEGLSPACVNVLWGAFNFAVAYVLLLRVGQFQPRRNSHALVFAAGALAMALMTSMHFAKFHGGL